MTDSPPADPPPAARPTLADAIRLAVAAHHDQVDKVGQPYILHPLRVMFRLETEVERIVGVLHDVVEDTPHTLDGLRALGYPPEVIAALDGVTARPGESYEAFVARLAPNPIARRVKLADLEDNLDLRRLPELTDRDVERLRRYRRAWSVLREADRAAGGRGSAPTG